MRPPKVQDWLMKLVRDNSFMRSAVVKDLPTEVIKGLHVRGKVYGSSIDMGYPLNWMMDICLSAVAHQRKDYYLGLSAVAHQRKDYYLGSKD